MAMKKLLMLSCLTIFCFSASSQQVTAFGQGTGKYGELFDNLKSLLLNSGFVDDVKLGGRQRTQFVPWIRDHVHVMKAMKYFEKDNSSFWEFYMETQTEEGLYFDYYYPVDDGVNHRMNLFDKRYWQVFSGEKLQMHRLPVEADLEYLMVEGAFNIWQATGDNNYIGQWIDKLEKGLYYSMNDPLRWSQKYQLVKRGYTLDTWDFMQLPYNRDEYTRMGHDVQEGIFDIDENTPMGIMHGDNSGMYAACRQLSIMHKSLGNNDKSEIWEKQAEIFRMRLNSTCWNGNYYAHFIEDDPMPQYLKMDQKNTLSLSNPYDINRGVTTHDMAASIIRKYQSLKEKNEMNSFSEWFGIYPPVRPHFADYEPGSYMNGGVNTIVGGELAKAAFQNGFEEYGVDILNRMSDLLKKHNGDLPVAYKPDGTVDEGIPDNWGQAAVMSALIEGLAGVVDKGKLFSSVELSPRWLAAGKDSASISVAYPSSGKSIQYLFRHEPAGKRILMTVSGDPGSYTIRFLLPENSHIAGCSVNGKSVKVMTEKVEESIYAVTEINKSGKHKVILSYR
jgi:hypothetical protein